MNILRAGIFHTPRNAFQESNALDAYADGALVVDNGRIAACGDYAVIARNYPNAETRDLRPGYLLPGFVDTHTHYPQTRIIGGLGLELLDWLEQFTLPEESRLSDAAYAQALAREFITGLASHGTTTALVFGSHFAPATACLFEEAKRRGLRIYSGLVFGDRHLRPELQQTPEAGYKAAKALIARFPNYVITPRFAFSCSQDMLDMCGTLLREHPGLLFTTHINESAREIEEVRRLFPWAEDYLAVYDNYDLIGDDSILAHNVHPGDSELELLAEREASIAHCPCSNAALGSGIFPMHRHLEKGVHFALGTDVAAGTGFGMLKETLQAYLLQRLAADPITLSPAQMLYLATRAGAEALKLDDEIGDFCPGKSADYVYVRGSFSGLAALLTLAGPSCIGEVRVHDHVVFAG